ncbi:hypothetical protein lbkm_2724 [Lachnospiraceae bacterium KM106-2]|nr:hypothetical protein lbkm_2724 [Lachnospiraceae bacterium KM106-2]
MKKRITALILSMALLITSLSGMPPLAKAAETNVTARAASDVTIDETNFPDSIFRDIIKGYDSDNNDILSRDEIEQVQTLDIENKGITRLDGINYLTSLYELNCSGNKLTSLDVTKLSELEILKCGKNELTTLNVSGLSRLTNLLCENNNLNKIDLTGVTRLTKLECNNNEITSLDVSKLTRLDTLVCSNNMISKLDLSNSKSISMLFCGSNQISELDISKLTGLKFFDCSNNQIEEINVANNVDLTTMTVSNNKLISLDVSNQSSKLSLECNKNSRQVYVNPSNEVIIKLPADFGSKVSELKGASYNASENKLTTYDGVTEITYQYNAGNTNVVDFTLSITHDKKIEITPQKVNLYVTEEELSNGTAKGSNLAYKLFGFTSDQITWSSADDTKVVVDSNGMITPKKFGETTVTVSAVEDNGNGLTGDTFKAQVNVRVFKEASNLVVDPIDIQYHTGYAVEPTIKVSANGTELVKDREYTYTFEKNINAGEAKVIIKGVVPYNFTVEKTFTIAYDLSKAVVTPANPKDGEPLVFEDLVYSGKTLKPAFTVAYDGNMLTGQDITDVTNPIIKSGVDYTYEYSYTGYANQALSDSRRAAIYIKGVGDYSGKITKYLTILPRAYSTDLFDVRKVPDQVYTGSEILPDIEMYFNKSAFAISKEYYTVKKVKESDNIYAGTASVDNINVGLTTVEVSLKGNFSGSFQTQFRIVPLYLKATEILVENKENPTYTGSACYPDVEVSFIRDGEKVVLQKDKDFEFRPGKKSTDQGEADAVIQLIGNYEGSKAIQYTIKSKDATNADVTIADQTYTGSPIIPEAVITDSGKTLNPGTDYHIEAVKNQNNTTVGTAYANIVFGGNYSGTKEVEYQIVAKKIAEANIEVSDIPDQTYTGTIILPDVTVRDKVTGTRLDFGKDYKVSAEYATNSDQGTAIMLITLMGNYSGSKEVSFTINPKHLEAEQVAVSGLESKVYTGEVMTPNPMLYFGDRKLELNKDYTIDTIDGKNNKNVGTAYFRVNFKNNYSGSKDIQFEITKKAADESKFDVSLVKSDYEYTGSEQLPEVVVTYGDDTLTKGTDYEVEKINQNPIVEPGTYEAIIRLTRNYSGSKKVTFKIVQKVLGESNIDINKIDKITFTQSEILPTVIVRDHDNNRPLTEGKDYQVTRVDGLNNIIAGDAYAKLVFQGNYTGEAQVSFTIEPKEVTHGDISIEPIADQVYNGSPMLPDVIIKDKSVTLVKGTDYTISEIANKNITNATTPSEPAEMLLTMKGNYKGSKVLTFNINPQPVDTTTIELHFDQISKSTYTGDMVLPKLPVSINGTPMEQNVDYVVEAISGKNCVAADKAYARVRLLGNYSATVDFEFTIDPKEVQANEIEVTGIVEQPYTGEAIFPGVKVTVNGEVLTKADYRVEAAGTKNNTLVGPAFANVVLVKNYRGTKEITYEIKSDVYLDSKDLTIEPVGPQSYTGKEIYPDIVLKYGETELVRGKDKDYELIPIPTENNKNLGPAKVQVNLLNKYRGNKEVSFTIVEKELTKDEVTIAPIDDFMFNRKEQLPELSMEYNGIQLMKDIDYTVTASGDKNATNVGTAYAMVTFKGNFTGSFEVEYGITKKAVLSSDIIVEDITPQEYTGTPILPNLVVKDASDPTYQYEQGKDYTVSAIPNENCTNAGTAKIAFEFTGNYSGQGRKEFMITAKKLSSDAIEISQVNEVSYTGYDVIPEVIVKDGTTVLQKDRDYSVSTVFNKNSVKAEKAYILVTLEGNYTGTKEFSYQIQPKELIDSQITVESVSDKEYNGEVVLPDMTVKYGSIPLVENEDYTIQQGDKGDNINVGTREAKIRLTKNYSGSKNVSYEIVQKTLNGTNTTVDKIADQVYAREALTPDTAIYDGKFKLVLGKDYTLSGVENKNNLTVGHAFVKATFKGNYNGSIEIPFEIIQKALAENEITIEKIESKTYTGTAIIPEVVVKDGSVTLKKDEDYKVTILDGYENVNASEAAIKVTLRGNYSGSNSAKFMIEPKELTSKDVETAEIVDQTYTGKSILPDVKATFGTKELVAGTDYDIVPSDKLNCTNAGGAFVRYQFKGNYSGYKDIPFKIVAHEIVNDNLKVTSNATEVYTGGTILPEMQVSYNGKNLVATTDYDVVAVQGGNSTNVGDAVVKIEFKKNYSGSKQVAFKIVARDLTEDMVVISDKSDEIYTGEVIIPEIKLSYGSTTLKKGTDYTITAIRDENQTIVGDAKVLVTFKGNYHGSFEYEYSIIQKHLSEDAIFVKAVEDQVYTGEEIIPVLVVKDGERTLELNKDYVVDAATGKNNKTIGDAYVDVTLQGNYTGSKQVEFKIIQKNVVGSEIIITDFEDDNVTSTIVIPDVIVWDGDEQLKEGTDYTVEIVKLPNNMNSIKFYLKGDHANSPNITYTIITKTIDSNVLSIAKIPNQTYTGEAIVPDVKIKYGKVTLVKGQDYELSGVENVNNTETGNAKVKVNFINSFSGSAELSFNIVATEATSDEIAISNISSPEYTGGVVFPEVSVECKGKTLKYGTDYVMEPIDSANQIEVGSAKAKIVLKGNYSGEKEVNYEIVKRTLDEMNIVVTSVSDEIQTGSIVLPKITLEYKGTKLQKDVDYVFELIDGEDNVDVGTAKVKVSFIGSYSGEMVITYRIVGEQILSDDITVKANDVPFSNKAVKPEIELEINKTIDRGQLDYEIEFLEGEDNINVGEVRAKVVLKGYYSGSKEFTYRITPKQLTTGGIFINYDKKLEFTGSELLPSNISIAYGDWNLEEGKDYSVEKLDNVDYSSVGEKTLEIKFGGNYEGTPAMELRYEIVEKPVEVVPEEKPAEDNTPVAPDHNQSGDTTQPDHNQSDGTTQPDHNQSGNTTQPEQNQSGGNVTTPSVDQGQQNQSAAAKSILDASVAIKCPATVDYTGKAVKAAIKITDSGYILIEGVDYQLTYSNNKNLGTAKVMIRGMNAYKDSIEKTYRIKVGKVASLAAKSATTTSIKLSWKKQTGITGYEVYVYDKKKKKYKLLKRITGASKNSYTQKKLGKVTVYQYKVRSYKTVNKKKVYGSYSAVLKTSTAPAAPSLKVTAKKKAMDAKWKAVKGASGYEVYTATSKKGKYKKATTIKKVKTVKYTKKSLKSKKTYYVKMRAYKTVSGKKVYSAYSKVVSVKVK